MDLSLTGMTFTKNKQQGTTDCVLLRGDTVNQVFTLRDAATLIPLNLIGYTGRFTAARRLEDDDYEIQLTTANGGMVLGGVAGTVNLIMSASATAALPVFSGVYELALTNGAGTHTYARGRFRAVREVK